MNRPRKNFILLIIIGILVSGIPAIALCSSYCISSALGSPQDANCSSSTHSFDQLAILLWALILLPFAGLFPGKDSQLMPPGISLPLFNPPDFVVK
jgi:hypothetical protein